MICSRSRRAPGVPLAFVVRGWLAAAIVSSAPLLGVDVAWARAVPAKAPPRRSNRPPSSAASRPERLDATIARRKKAYQKSGDPRLLFELGELHLRSGLTLEAQRFYNAFLHHEPAAEDRLVAEGRLREIEVARAASAPSIEASSARPSIEASSAAPAARSTMAWAATPAAATTPPPFDSRQRPTPSEQAASHPEPPPIVSPSAPQPTPPPAPQASPPPQEPPTLPSVSPRSDPPPEAAAMAGPSLLAVTTSPSVSPTSNVDATLPVPSWVPLFGAVVTGGLLAGAIVGGRIADQRYDDLRQSCAMTEAGCPPERIAGLRSLARVANALWIAAAVTGAGTGIAVFLDTRAGGMSKTWSF